MMAKIAGVRKEEKRRGLTNLTNLSLEEWPVQR
jgi:hypothetical protein